MSPRTAELVQVAGRFVERVVVGPLANAVPSEDDYENKIANVTAKKVAKFIQNFYLGYVHLRAAELRRYCRRCRRRRRRNAAPPDRTAAPGRRPVFAFLCNQAVINRLERAARAAGAADGTGTGRDGPNGVDGYGRFLRAINRLSFSPEGEPLRRLVEPYLVRVATVNPFTVSTLMYGCGCGTATVAPRADPPGPAPWSRPAVVPTRPRRPQASGTVVPDEPADEEHRDAVLLRAR